MEGHQRGKPGGGDVEGRTFPLNGLFISLVFLVMMGTGHWRQKGSAPVLRFTASSGR